MKVSIASYAFHGLLRAEKMDVYGYLESCRYRYGLDTADIWNRMLVSTEDDYLEKVKDALAERELTLVNLCVDGAHVWEDDAETRECNRRDALAHLRAAEVLGAKTVRIDAGGGHDDEAFTDEQFEFVVKSYKEYAQRAYDNGYMVGPENHWGPEKVPANMLRICEAVGSPAFGVLLHIGGWRGPDAERGDELIASHVMHTHISWNITESCLEEKMAMLRDVGYEGCWGVEHHTGKNEYTEVAVQVARVRDVLDRWRAGEA